MRSHQRRPAGDGERRHRHAQPRRRIPGRPGALRHRAGPRCRRARARVGPPVPQRQQGGGSADHAGPRGRRRGRGARGHPGGADHGGGPRRGFAVRAPAHAEALQRSHRGGPAPARGVRGHRHPQHADAGPRASDAGGGGEREPDQGRVPGHALPRAAHAAAPPSLGWAQLLRAGQLDPRERRPRRSRAIERNARAQASSSTTCSTSRASSPASCGWTCSPVDLAPGGARRRSTRCGPAADAKAVTLEVARSTPGLPAVPGDPDRLQQVVWNLLSNAVKFTPQGGRVDGDGAPRRRLARSMLAVADTGRGHQRRVPAPRLRALPPGRDSTRPRHGGLGLGLAIVRHLVELHGGSVARAERRGQARARRSPCACRWRRRSAPPSARPPR